MRRTLPIAVLLALAPAAFAGHVRLLTPGGDQVFAQIHEAVAAAGEGDAILVGAGTYSGFAIDGKSLSIFCVPGDVVTLSTASLVEVRNLGAEQRVVLSGFASIPLVELRDDAGFVRLQDCGLGDGSLGALACELQIPLQDGGTSVLVESCSNVAFADCTIVGVQGQSGDPFESWDCNCDPGDGGIGLRALFSRIALYQTVVRGGTGGSTTYCGGLGGRGLVTTSSQILASGGSISGGFGGWSWTGGGAGGIGAFLNASTTLRTLGCPVQGGTGSSTGNATGGAGAITALPGLARRIGAPVIARADQPLAVSWQGTSNDVVWLPRSVPFDHVFLGTLSGDWLTEMPPPTRLPFAGIASVLGHLDASLVLPSLAPGAPFATIAVQGLTLAPIPPDPLVVTGSTTTAAQAWERGWLPRYGVLASVRHALVIDPATGVDCNSNGVNDLLDVLLGTSPDANGDLRPDECP